MRLSCRYTVGLDCFGMRHRMRELTEDEPHHEQQDYRPALKDLTSHP